MGFILNPYRYGGGASLQHVVSHWDASTYTSGTLTDSVGSSDLTLTLWTTHSLNGLTALKRSTSNSLARLETTTHPLTTSQPLTLIAVYKQASGDDLLFDTGSSGGTGVRPHVHTAGVTNWYMHAGTNTNTAVAEDTVNAHVFAAVFDGSSSYFWRDGTKYGPFNPGTGTPGTNAFAFGNVTGGGLIIGVASVFAEAYLSDAVEDDDAISAVSASLKSKWGTP